MTNREISKAFKLAAQLMDLHGENSFRSKSLLAAAFRIERAGRPLAGLPEEELVAMDGIGKNTASKIAELAKRNSFSELDQLVSRTPPGILDMLRIKGVGPKKVNVLWKTLGIESVGELLYACNENRLVGLQGFGVKTQEQIRQAIEYKLSSAVKHHYATVEEVALQLVKDLEQSGLVSECSLTGGMRRCLEVIDLLEILVAPVNPGSLLTYLEEHPLLDSNSVVMEGGNIIAFIGGSLKVVFLLCEKNLFIPKLFETTATPNHISVLREKHGLGSYEKATTEEEIYRMAGLPFFEPELREGEVEFGLLNNNSLPELVTEQDLRGILHNHTTYSDGADTVEEMASYCASLGYTYIGITDHSKSAFYANGLDAGRIMKQQEEIDALNKKPGSIKIFKGIESDILNDGSLDYPDEILASFDFIVASIHSQLQMDEAKATARLIKAVENPYTTILGHPTGRLLLARKGYPIDHRKVIDACAANGVIIEMNSNPYRLDMDWRFIPYALGKGVMISINPDAHRKEGFRDMHFGTLAARKGGLTREMTFNAKSADEVTAHFLRRKQSR